MGSKQFMCDKILKALPSAENFYDLFGGGFSVSHCALLINKWKSVFYNEIKSDVVDLVRDSINGKYNYSVFRPEWISKKDFLDRKGTDAYVRCIWSFGNNQKDYLFNQTLEKNKRSLHNAVIFGKFDDFAKKILGFDRWDKNLSLSDRRLFSRQICSKGNKQLRQLQQLERLQQLEQLEQLERLQQLELSSLSYDDVKIKPNSIIYCDPPYVGTSSYDTIQFDHNKFFSWVEANKHPVFFSEYKADDRFELVFQKPRKPLLSSCGRRQMIEKVFANKAGTELLKK